MTIISGRMHTTAAGTLAALLFSLPAMAQHQHQHHPKKQAHSQIEALEHQWQVAMLADDVTAMDKLLSDDYLGITGTGELLTKAQQLDRMKTRNINISQLTTSDVKIKLVGSIAIVTSLAQVEGVSNGTPLQGSYRYTRVYQRLPSGVWKVTSFEATHIPRSGRRQQQADAGPPPH
jgi:ketosteroid isomerase-like protein